MRKIAVVTGSRADYGLLRPLLRLLKDDPDIDLQLIVCGAHLATDFGFTKRFIEEDRFDIAAEVDMDISSDSPAGIAKSIGLGCIGFGAVYERLKPDILVLLGDRFEILAAAEAAMVANIPIAHLHGGEVTEGAVDEAIRHSITKMSHLHFVAAEPYRRRVIQLGEDPVRVFNVGAIGLDDLLSGRHMSKDEVVKALSIDLTRPIFLVTYHPVTLLEGDQVNAMRNMFRAFDRYPEATLIVTYSNSDTFGRALLTEIERYVAENPKRVMARPSLGQRLYLGVMLLADCVVGNSSSGVIEAPSAGVPTVNIGPRQKGRLRAESVVDCSDEEDAITSALKKALSPEFRKLALKCSNPYGDGGAAKKIHKCLREVKLENILMKRFFDLTEGSQLNGH